MITVVGPEATQVGHHLAQLSGGVADPPAGPLGLVIVHPRNHADHGHVSALLGGPALLAPNDGLLKTAALYTGARAATQPEQLYVSFPALERTIDEMARGMPGIRDSNDEATARHIVRQVVVPALGFSEPAVKGVYLVPRHPHLFHTTASAQNPAEAASQIWQFYASRPHAGSEAAAETLRFFSGFHPCPQCQQIGRPHPFAAPVCAACLHGTVSPVALAGSDLAAAKPAPSPFEDVVLAKVPEQSVLRGAIEKLQSSTSRDYGAVRLPAKDVPNASAFNTIVAHAAKLQFLKKAGVYSAQPAVQRTNVVALTESLGSGKSFATSFYTLADRFEADLGDSLLARLVITRTPNGDRKAAADTIDVTVRQWKVSKSPHESGEIEVAVTHKTPTTTQPEYSAMQLATELLRLVSTPATENNRVRLNTAVMGPGRVTVGTGAAPSDLEPNQSVILTAAPDAGSRFESWRGDCHGKTPTCEIKTDHDANVTAVFVPNISMSVPAVHVGDRQVEVQFATPQQEFTPTKWDWIGWFKVGSDDRGYLTWDWTRKQSTGKLRLKPPAKTSSGEYELRYYTYDKKKYAPVARKSFVFRPASVPALLGELTSKSDSLLTKGLPTEAEVSQRLKSKMANVVVRSQRNTMPATADEFQRIAYAVSVLNFTPDEGAQLLSAATPVMPDSVFSVTRQIVPGDKSPIHVVTYYDVLELLNEEGPEAKVFRFVANSHPDSLINAGITIAVKLQNNTIDLFVEKRQEHGTLLKKFYSAAEHEDIVERNVASIFHHLTVAAHVR